MNREEAIESLLCEDSINLAYDENNEGTTKLLETAGVDISKVSTDLYQYEHYHQDMKHSGNPYKDGPESLIQHRDSIESAIHKVPELEDAQVIVSQYFD